MEIIEIEEKQLQIILNYLENDFLFYPYSSVKDVKYFTQLLMEFRDLNIIEELKQYHAWVLDQPEEKEISYRSRFRSWLKMAQQFKSRPSHSTFLWRRLR